MATLLRRIEFEGLTAKSGRKVFPYRRQWRRGIVEEVAKLGFKIRLGLQCFVKFNLMNVIDT